MGMSEDCVLARLGRWLFADKETRDGPLDGFQGKVHFNLIALRLF